MFYGIGDITIKCVVTKTGYLSKTSVSLHRYPGTGTLNDKNGTRGTGSC